MAASLRTTRCKRGRFALSLVFVLLVTLALVQSAHSIRNNRKLCKEPLAVGYCAYGSHMPDPKCPDNRYCYQGPGDQCQDEIAELQCAPNLTCRGRYCMNCLNDDCYVSLYAKNVIERLRKRFERRRIE